MKTAKYGMAPEGYDWYKMLDAYIEHKKQHGRNPRCAGKGAEETRLYYWMMNQTRLIKQGHISAEHYQALVDAGVDIPNKGNIYDQYMRNIAAVKKEVPKKGSSLYSWLLIQFNKRDELQEWQREALDNTGLSIEMVSVNAQRWMNVFETFLSEWQTGSLSRRNATWGQSQVRHLQKGTLAEWKVVRLQGIGIGSDTVIFSRSLKERDRFEEKYAEYQQFLKENKRLPRQNRCQKEMNLYSWRRQQIQLIEAGTYSDDRVKRLQQVGIYPGCKAWNRRSDNAKIAA